MIQRTIRTPRIPSWALFADKSPEIEGFFVVLYDFGCVCVSLRIHCIYPCPCIIRVCRILRHEPSCPLTHLGQCFLLTITGNFTAVDHYHAVGHIVDVKDVMVDKDGGFTRFLDAVHKVDQYGCLFEQRPMVGSSRTMISASKKRARTMATPCFSPPEYWPTWESGLTALEVKPMD